MLEYLKSHTDYQGETCMDKAIDNQQEILTQAEIGWLAGIIDGDGSITMNVRKKNWKGWSGIGVDMNVYIVNTDARIIEKAMGILQKIGTKPYIFERENSPIKHPGSKVYSSPKNVLALNVTKMGEILKVLDYIHPHLCGEKQSRANIIRQFITRRMVRKGEHTKQGSSWYDGYDWGLVNQFYEISGGKLMPEVKNILNDYTSSQLEKVG